MKSELYMKLPEASKEPVIIERAVPDDAEAMLAIKRQRWLDRYSREDLGLTLKQYEARQKQIADEFDENMAENIERWMINIANISDTNMPFVARLNGQVEGFLIYREQDNKHMIGQLYVATEAEGMGIGSKLMKNALAYHDNNKGLYLHVNINNHRAIDFYRNFGFVATGKEIEPDETSLYDQSKEIELVRKANMKRFVIVHLLEPKSTGEEFLANSWPLHSTIAYPFNIDCDAIVISKKLGSVLLNHHAFDVKSLKDDYYGPQKDILVTPLEKSSAIMALSRDVCKAIIDLGGIPENPAYYKDNGHRPHITVQDHNRIHEGDVIDINSVTIIESIPKIPINVRKVLDTIYL